MGILKKLLIGLVILWGLLALLVRAATPFVADYRERLADLMAQQLGAPVEIGALKARWYGVRPLLEFDRVRIGEPAGELLEVERVTLDLAPDRLLRGALLDAMRLTVDGMQLTLVREPTGQIHLAGVGMSLMGGARDPGALALPGHLRLLNTRVSWIDRKTGAAPLLIDDVAVALDRAGSRVNLRASLQTDEGRAELSARLDGPLSATSWGGDTYLRVSGLDVAGLFAPYVPPSYGLRGLDLDLESWGRWENAAPVHNQGRFQLRDLDLRPKTADVLPLRVHKAGARFSIRRDVQGLHVGLHDLQLAFDDHQWPTGDLAFALLRQADDGPRLEAAADYLRIEDVVRILQVRLPWGPLKGPLAQLGPSGEVHDLRLSVDLGAQPPAWRGRARLSGISTLTWGGIPGVENLSGALHGQQDHLKLHLDSRAAALHFDRLFRDPIALQELDGRLDLVRTSGGWRLSTEALRAVSPHISTLTRLHLEQRPDAPLFVDLQTDFRDGDAAFASRYYPVSIMGEGLVRWLERSIVSGRVRGGSALLHGPLDGFPFEKGRDGVFQVLFDTEDLVLDYREGWPRIEGLGARVKFHGNQLDIRADSGSIYDSRMSETRAHIESLNPASAIRIIGRLDGPLRDPLRVLGEPALRARFGRYAEMLHGEGDSRLDLDVRIPLAKGGRGAALQGRLALEGNRLSLHDRDLGLDEVSGALDFTLDGLSARGIRARALGTSVSVDVLPLGDGTTRLQARGRLAPSAMAPHLGALPTALLTGDADLLVRLDILPRGSAPADPTRLVVESDLAGIGIALPAPFGKAAADSRPFRLQIPFDGDDTPGSLDYAGQVSARFSHDAARVDVVVGGGEARLQPTPGIRIGGRLAALDLVAWGEALAALPPGDGRVLPTLDADLRIDRVQADSAAVEQLHLTARHHEGVWQGEVDAANLAGRFSVPAHATATPIRVELQRLNLAVPLGEPQDDAAPPPDPASGPDPTTLPGLVLDIADLRVNEARLGRLRVEALHAEEGLRLTELSLRGGQLELDSAGHWSRERGAFRTQLGGRVSTERLGDLLVALGYSRQIEEAGSSAEFLLAWPGSPMQFHRAHAQGRVGLDIGAGRLVELDPGVTRVVGLLNLNALTRRLRLDFSDIYKKGYSFDSIEADFRFDRGSARTERLTMLGPTGRVDVTGSADLLARTLDQKVVVTPNIDATLPIAGAIAGGPIAGLAVLVAQKLMTRQVDNINRFEYSVRGPWGEPEIRRLDTGGALSQILTPSADAGGVTPAGDGEAEAAAPDAPAAPQAGALRRLLDLLPKGEPHEGYLPEGTD